MTEGEVSIAEKGKNIKNIMRVCRPREGCIVRVEEPI